MCTCCCNVGLRKGGHNLEVSQICILFSQVQSVEGIKAPVCVGGTGSLSAFGALALAAGNILGPVVGPNTLHCYTRNCYSTSKGSILFH